MSRQISNIPLFRARAIIIEAEKQVTAILHNLEDDLGRPITYLDFFNEDIATTETIGAGGNSLLDRDSVDLITRRCFVKLEIRL